MQTRITSPFITRSVDKAFVAEVMTAASIADFQVDGLTQDPEGITFTSNRHLTAAEKSTVKQVFLSALLQITDL